MAPSAAARDNRRCARPARQWPLAGKLPRDGDVSDSKAVDWERVTNVNLTMVAIRLELREESLDSGRRLLYGESGPFRFLVCGAMRVPSPLFGARNETSVVGRSARSASSKGIYPP